MGTARLSSLEANIAPHVVAPHRSNPVRYGSARCWPQFARTLKDCSTQGQIMKKTPTLIAALACSLAGIAPLAAIATPAPDLSSTEATLVIKDSSITSSIKAELASDP